MADISSIVPPGSTTEYTLKDATARTQLAGKQDALTAGDGIDITSDVISNTQGIEYIVGTQTAATNAWTGVSTDSSLVAGKIIAYKLPYAGTSSAATLNLTLSDGTTTGAIALRRTGSSTVTTHFAVNNVIVMIYDGTYWRVSAYYDANSNTVPTGYCTTAAGTAAKSATCTYGYRDDATYFPCLFRYANTASNATLAIASYATTALPIYVNGARTTSSNTFGRGVVMFLYYNSAYYCYNDGRFPIVLNGAVTSVQDALESNAYTLPAATTSTLGGVKVDGSTITIADGVISASGGGSSSAGGLLVTVTQDSVTFTADKTAQEIYDALEAGVMPTLFISSSSRYCTTEYIRSDGSSYLDMYSSSFGNSLRASSMSAYPSYTNTSGGSND